MTSSLTAEAASPAIPAPAECESVEVVSATDAHEWDAYVRRHPDATADHLWGWRTVVETALGHRSQYLIARRRGIACGVLPLVFFRSKIFGRSVVSLPFLNYGGILADDSAAVDALVEVAAVGARAFGASHIELRHVQRQCERLPFRQHKLRMVRPLETTPESQWNAVDRKIRNQVRKAQKEGLTSVHGGRELLDDFYAVFAENMRDLGTPVYPKALFSGTLATFSDRAQIVLVRQGNRPIAGAVTIRFRQTVLNPWASSLRRFRPLSPNVLLYWSMIDQAVRAGATAFDFGRSSPGGGTHQFKLQWGAAASPMHWEYVLLGSQPLPDQGPSNPRFAGAIALWKKLPLSVANVLGPMLARHLP